MPYKCTAKITGKKQGALKGGSRIPGTEGQCEVFHLATAIELPVNQATGVASGQAVHRPIGMKLMFDAAYPQLMQAIQTAELVDVDLSLWNVEGATMKLQGKITANDCLITRHVVSSPDVTDERNKEQEPYVWVECQYKKVTYAHQTGGTEAEALYQPKFG